MAVAWVNCWRSPAPRTPLGPGHADAGSAGAASRCQSQCYTPTVRTPIPRSFDIIPSRKKNRKGKKEGTQRSGPSRTLPYLPLKAAPAQPSLLRAFTRYLTWHRKLSSQTSPFISLPSPFPAPSPLLLYLDLSLSQIPPARLPRPRHPCHHICTLHCALSRLCLWQVGNK